MHWQTDFSSKYFIFLSHAPAKRWELYLPFDGPSRNASIIFKLNPKQILSSGKNVRAPSCDLWGQWRSVSFSLIATALNNVYPRHHKQNLTTNTCSYFSCVLITQFSSNGSNYLVTLFWCELNIVNSTGCWCPTSSLVIAGDHPAADGAAGRRPEGVRTLVRHEDGEQPHRRDQMPPPGHHHVPGAHDPHSDVVDDGCPQVHEQFAGQEDEWRHELRVRILREVCNKKIWFFFVGPSQFWSLLKKAFT